MNATWMRPSPSSVRQRAQDETTSHRRLEPDTPRLDETASRPHLVPEDRQLINVAGVSVDPAAVEEVISRHPKVARAAVIGIPDAGTGEAVKAFIILTEGGSAEQILTWMRNPTTGMARHLVPKHLEFRQSLPPTMDREPETAALHQVYIQKENRAQ